MNALQSTSGVDLKWFVREVRSIVVRNLRFPGEPNLENNHLFNPRLTIAAVTRDGSLTIYEGAAVTSSCNPTWTFAGLQQLANPWKIDTRELSFRIYNTDSGSLESSVENTTTPDGGEDDPDKFELIIRVDLRTLCSIGNVQLKNISSLPVNSLLFATDEGYYACSSLFERVRIPISGSASGEQLTIRAAADKGHENADSDAAIRAKMDSSLKTIEVLREEASASLGDMEAARETILRSAKAEALAKLRDEVARAEAEAAAEESAEDSERADLFDTTDLQDSVAACAQLYYSIEFLKKESKMTKQELAKSKFFVEARQLKLLSELQSIYPIVLLESGDYTIRGVELPADIYSPTVQRDDEQISTAFGYIVHVLLLISKYFDIPLRYQLIFCSSRSMIMDASGSAASSTVLPLYKRGIEKERLDVAIAWLRRDLHQLLACRGIEYEPSKDLLYNLNKLYSCHECGRLAL